jgi:hypothetical protein
MLNYIYPLVRLMRGEVVKLKVVLDEILLL